MRHRLFPTKKLSVPLIPTTTRSISHNTQSSDATRFLQARDFLLLNLENYSVAYQEFHWPTLTNFNWALDYFDHMAKGNYQSGLVVVNEKGISTHSFDDLYYRSNQVANFFEAHGIASGARVLIMLPNIPELWESHLALIKTRAVIVPATTLLSPKEITARMKAANISHVITSSKEIAKFKDIDHSFQLIAIDGDAPNCLSYVNSYRYSKKFTARELTNVASPLLLYFTSGTTAQPKLVEHTHQSYPIGHLSTMYWLGVTSKDLHMNIAAPGWAKHSWSSFFAPWNAGAGIVSYGFDRFDSKQLLETLTQQPITSLCAPPTVWRMLRQQPLVSYQIQLRNLLSAGEPLNAEIIREVKHAWKIDIREGYGQTETTALMGYCLGQSIVPGTMGHPLPGYQLKILGENGNEATEGELAVSLNPRPIGLMTGYNDSEKTKQVMCDDFYRTGDTVALCANPHSFLFKCRTDNMIKSSGYRISSFELESAIMKYPDVIETAVISKPHQTKGHVPKAFVVLKSGILPTEELRKKLFNYLKKELSPYQRIDEIEFCDSLPKTISGKIQHAVLRKQELEKQDDIARIGVVPRFIAV